MYSLLKRLSWGISVSLGFTLTLLIGMYFGVLRYVDDETIFIVVIFGVIFAILIKKIIFPASLFDGIARTRASEEHQQTRPIPHKPFEMPVPQTQAAETHVTSPKINVPITPLATTESSREHANTVDSFITEKKEIPNEVRKTEVVRKSPPKKPHPAEPDFITRFFAENLLAKVGGILLFLGTLFLLQLVYTQIGPVGKLILGFLVGFLLFGIGVYMDQKKLIQEARIMMGTGILINYLVILAGRYLIGDTFTSEQFLSEGITFLLLILNTVFAVTVSLVYKSRPLLLFSFLFAYANPFLIGADAMSDPYTLLGYALAVSFGAFTLSHLYRQSDRVLSRQLLIAGFVGGILLALAAPFDIPLEWLFKLLLVLVFSLTSLFLCANNKQHADLSGYFVGSYMALAIIIIGGHTTLGNAADAAIVFGGNMIFLLALLGSAVFFFFLNGLQTFFAFLFLPLLVLLGLFSGGLVAADFVVPTLLLALFLYLGIFIFLLERLNLLLQLVFFGILGVFLFFAEFRVRELFMAQELTSAEAAAGIVAGLIFFAAALYFALEKKRSFLYSLGTILSIVVLLPLLAREGDLTMISAAAVTILVLANVLGAVLGKTIRESDIRNIIGGLLAAALFATGEMYWFGEKYYSGITTGLGFLLLAIGYFLAGYAIYSLSISRIASSAKADAAALKNIKDVTYGFLGIALSLFSLAVAFVFSQYGEVVAAAWVFESCILFFFYRNIKDIRIYAAANILMFIGIFKLSLLLTVVKTGDYLALIPLTIIAASLVVNLKLVEKATLRIVHDIIHVMGTVFLGLLLLQIIPMYGYGWDVVGVAMYFLVMAGVYAFVYSGQIPLVFLLALVGFFLYHNVVLESIFDRLDAKKLEYLKLLQYLAVVFVAGAAYLARRFRIDGSSHALFQAAFAIYFLAITTQFVYFAFGENTFAITVYWGILAFGMTGYGIQVNRAAMRTLGLYVLMLTVGKILLYDIWIGLDDAVSRIIALMFTGAIMVVLSVLYTKKYGQDLRGELNPENLYRVKK